MTTFGEAWRNARREAEQGDWEPVAGMYDVRVVDADAFAGKDGREWAKVILQVASGPHEGKSWTHGPMPLDPNGGGFKFTTEALLGYGVEADPESLDELADAMRDLVGREATVTVKVNPPYVNTYVSSSRTGRSDVASDLPPATAPAPGPSAQPTFPGVSRNDDDIPF